MIRNGIYTVYQEKEYPLGETILENEPIKYWIKSMDPNDLNNGFYLYERPKTMIIKGVEYELPPREVGKPNVYLKDITPSEIGEVYGINTFGIYKDCEVGVRMDDKTGENVLLGVGDAMTASKLGFEFDERGVYMKWVPKDEVYLFEKKEPMPNYFKSS